MMVLVDLLLCLAIGWGVGIAAHFIVATRFTIFRRQSELDSQIFAYMNRGVVIVATCMFSASGALMLYAAGSTMLWFGRLPLVFVAVPLFIAIVSFINFVAFGTDSSGHRSLANTDGFRKWLESRTDVPSKEESP